MRKAPDLQESVHRFCGLDMSYRAAYARSNIPGRSTKPSSTSHRDREAARSFGASHSPRPEATAPAPPAPLSRGGVPVRGDRFGPATHLPRDANAERPGRCRR